MLNEQIIKTYNDILNNELIEATGCTEPIAVALCGAVCRKYLSSMAKEVEVYCSGNMIKNVKGVTVPNSGGLKGIDVAVLLGLIGGNGDDALQVLSNINNQHRQQLQQELSKNYVKVFHQQNVPTLYVRTIAKDGKHSVEVELQKNHTNISRIVVDGKEIKNNHSDEETTYIGPDKNLLNIADILDYGTHADLNDVRLTLECQIKDNTAISDEGLKNNYGARVGKNLLCRDNHLYTYLRARAAAGSDARMNGCAMPVVINSGSGNQGMALSLPIIGYCEKTGRTHEECLRALAIANLLAVHQKKYIGALSAYCGAVSAASASAAAICWLKGGNINQVSKTLETSICTIGGMVCDGAKASCAAKISIALECAFNAMEMALADDGFAYGEGLIKKNAEMTIKAVGEMAREGMKETDNSILKIMLEK